MRVRVQRVTRASTLIVLVGVTATTLAGGARIAGAIDQQPVASAGSRGPVAYERRDGGRRSLVHDSRPRSSSASIPRDVRVPLLMYHVIGEPPAAARHAELYVSQTDFVGQMEWLESKGFTAVTLRAVWEHWQGRTELPPRPVVLTFDDGTRSIHARALPELAARGWPGVLDLDLSNLAPSWGISPEQVVGLLEAGWELASHSLTHPDLTGLGSAALRREVAGSRAALRRLFGVNADFFCYPSGRFDDRVVAAVEAAGYLGATTTVEGLADQRDPYRLARIRVERSDGVAGFAEKLAVHRLG